jgi:hypothetical protein
VEVLKRVQERVKRVGRKKTLPRYQGFMHLK